jgi:hypothetical protein
MGGGRVVCWWIDGCTYAQIDLQRRLGGCSAFCFLLEFGVGLLRYSWLTSLSLLSILLDHTASTNSSINFSLSCSAFSKLVVFHADLNEAGNPATKVNVSLFHDKAKETLHLPDRIKRNPRSR